MFPPNISPGATVTANDRPSADDLHREANHRIANNLSAIAGLVRLHAASLTTAETLHRHDVEEMLGEIGSRIEAVGRLHRMLSNLAPGSRIDLGEHLRDTCDALVASLSAGNRVSLSFRSTQACLLDPNQAGPVALIVSELVTNAIKHAHPTGVPGKIMVRSGQSLGGSIYVDVEDDGIGLPEDFDPWSGGGLGFRVIRGLAQQLGARLIFDAEGIGLKVKLIVPTA